MKKLISLSLSVIILICAFALVTSASDSNDVAPEVYVSIVKSGSYVVTYEKITVNDMDSDGILSVNDALYAAHEAKYEGGAAAGYGYYTGNYGISLGKLWGDTSGNFGYYVNNAMTYSLAQPLQSGDHITAYVYSDTVNYSDVYTYFDATEQDTGVGLPITITLSALTFDASWNTVSLPLANAKILINGEDSGIVTDADGKAQITFRSVGEFTVSAASDTSVLVPPICIIRVSEVGPDTGDGILLAVALTIVSALSVVYITCFIKKRLYEK